MKEQVHEAVGVGCMWCGASSLSQSAHRVRGPSVSPPPARRTVRLWSTELGANLASFRGHLFPVWDTAAAPGGQYLASASADRTARVWSTERAQSLRLLVGAHLQDSYAGFQLLQQGLLTCFIRR